MMQVATLSEPNYPPVKPRWLGPATTVAVTLAHVGFAFFLMTAAIEKIAPLNSISMDLMPEGDMFESEQVEATEDAVPLEEMEQPDLAIPLPRLMTPDAPPIRGHRKSSQNRTVKGFCCAYQSQFNPG